MAGDGITFSARTRMRALYHVHLLPVVLQEIEIHRREIGEWITEVAYHRHRFQENFGQYDGRSYVEINTALVHLPHQRAQQSKIVMRRPADCSALRSRMRVRRIGSHGYMNGDRYRRAIRLAKQAGTCESRIGDFLQTQPECLAETVLWVRAVQRFIHLAA